MANSYRKIKVLYVMNSCKNLGPTRQTLNIIKGMDRDRFEPFLLTLEQEGPDSLLGEYNKYVAESCFVPVSRVNILLGKDQAITRKIDEINPDIIHTVGVFVDYEISRSNRHKQVITIRNYAKEDYVSKYGILKGNLLLKMNRYAVRRADLVLTCSKSLSDRYALDGQKYDYIRNGIDAEYYLPASAGRRAELREELGLPKDKKIVVYTGQFIARKNVEFLLNSMADYMKQGDDLALLLVGDGPLFSALKQRFESENVIFAGQVREVLPYLQASDIYVSASSSEGMPNSVLEAMAVGLPVLLSDIPQHAEIVNEDSSCGLLFSCGDVQSFKKQLKILTEQEMLDYGNNMSRNTVLRSFSAENMSKCYQAYYEQLSEVII